MFVPCPSWKFYYSHLKSLQFTCYIAHEQSLHFDRFADPFFASLDIARAGYLTAFLHAATIGSMPSVMNTSLSRGSSPPDKVSLLVRFIFFCWKFVLLFCCDCWFVRSSKVKGPARHDGFSFWRCSGGWTVENCRRTRRRAETSRKLKSGRFLSVVVKKQHATAVGRKRKQKKSSTTAGIVDWLYLNV